MYLIGWGNLCAGLPHLNPHRIFQKNSPVEFSDLKLRLNRITNTKKGGLANAKFKEIRKYFD